MADPKPQESAERDASADSKGADQKETAETDAISAVGGKAGGPPGETPPPPSLEEALKWIGMRVDDWGGRRLGKVSGIHLDVETREPKWVIVRMGPMAGDAAIPFAHVAEAGGRIWTAYERTPMRHSPKLSADQSLSARQELQLCEHYGIAASVGRAAELAKRQDEPVTAVPAQQ